jgi:hypothetical protein
MTYNGKTITNTTTLPDEKVEQMLNAGFSINEVERFYVQLEYRKEYNSRPEVKQKRAEYNKTRYNRMKGLRELLKGGE